MLSNGLYSLLTRFEVDLQMWPDEYLVGLTGARYLLRSKGWLNNEHTIL
jgi:hypothetical protein